jgi:hypothetical protein
MNVKRNRFAIARFQSYLIGNGLGESHCEGD